MDASVMVGRGTGGAAAVFILIVFILLLGARSSRSQKGDGCGHTVLGVGSGSLASLGYPLSYPSNCVCEWEISVTTGHTIIVRIADLDIDTNNCQVSYLRFYNGHGPGRMEIVKFCGGREWRDAVIQSEGHQVTVQFMSGPHNNGRGLFLSYTKSQHTDLITCLEKGKHFSEAEFSKFCPAGCLTDFGEVSGTIPHGYRDSSPLCLAGIHAGVVSNTLGGQISVVSSKGIPHYESSLANNVTSVPGNLSPSLFTFKTSGCYGTLGLESGVVSDSQITASSEWEWGGHGKEPTVWGPTGARLKTPGRPWAAANSDTKEWIQVDLKKEKKITGRVCVCVCVCVCVREREREREREKGSVIGQSFASASQVLPPLAPASKNISFTFQLMRCSIAMMDSNGNPIKKWNQIKTRFSKATPTISRKCGTTLFLQLKHALSEYVPCSGTRGSPLKWSCWAANLMQRGQESSIQPLLPLAEKAQCPPYRRGRHTRPTSETPPCLRTLTMRWRWWQCWFLYWWWF
uniref:Discoidin, CUB and LCCL domain containing 2 n=1 Tax=Cyprinus carpio TaxID=7962 RepID=A0A8C1ZJF1_CYPCA